MVSGITARARRRAIFFAVFFLCFQAMSGAETYTWTGVVNSAWTNTGNWVDPYNATGGYPGMAATDNAYIDATAVNMPFITSNITCDLVQISQTGAVLTINGRLNCEDLNVLAAAAVNVNGYLEIGNNLNSSAGTLTNIGTVEFSGSPSPPGYTNFPDMDTVYGEVIVSGGYWWLSNPAVIKSLTVNGSGAFRQTAKITIRNGKYEVSGGGSINAYLNIFEIEAENASYIDIRESGGARNDVRIPIQIKTSGGRVDFEMTGIPSPGSIDIDYIRTSGGYVNFNSAVTGGANSIVLTGDIDAGFAVVTLTSGIDITNASGAFIKCGTLNVSANGTLDLDLRTASNNVPTVNIVNAAVASDTTFKYYSNMNVSALTQGGALDITANRMTPVSPFITASGNGSVMLNGPVLLGIDTPVSAGDALVFSGTVNGNFSLNASGKNITFSGIVGGSVPLNFLTAGTTAAAPITVNTSLIKTVSGQTWNSAVALYQSAEFSGGNITFFHPVTFDADSIYDITFGGTILAYDAIGTVLKKSGNLTVTYGNMLKFMNTTSVNDYINGNVGGAGIIDWSSANDRYTRLWGNWNISGQNGARTGDYNVVYFYSTNATIAQSGLVFPGISMSSATLTLPANFEMSVMGGWDVNGTCTINAAESSHVRFNGSGSIYVLSNSTLNPFGKVTIDTSSTYTLVHNMGAKGDVTLQNGTLTGTPTSSPDAGYILDTDGAFTQSGGIISGRITIKSKKRISATSNNTATRVALELKPGTQANEHINWNGSATGGLTVYSSSNNSSGGNITIVNSSDLIIAASTSTPLAASQTIMTTPTGNVTLSAGGGGVLKFEGTASDTLNFVTRDLTLTADKMEGVPVHDWSGVSGNASVRPHSPNIDIGVNSPRSNILNVPGSAIETYTGSAGTTFTIGLSNGSGSVYVNGPSNNIFGTNDIDLIIQSPASVSACMFEGGTLALGGGGSVTFDVGTASITTSGASSCDVRTGALVIKNAGMAGEALYPLSTDISKLGKTGGSAAVFTTGGLYINNSPALSILSSVDVGSNVISINVAGNSGGGITQNAVLRGGSGYFTIASGTGNITLTSANVFSLLALSGSADGGGIAFTNANTAGVTVAASAEDDITINETAGVLNVASVNSITGIKSQAGAVTLNNTGREIYLGNAATTAVSVEAAGDVVFNSGGIKPASGATASVTSESLIRFTGGVNGAAQGNGKLTVKSLSGTTAKPVIFTGGAGNTYALAELVIEAAFPFSNDMAGFTGNPRLALRAQKITLGGSVATNVEINTANSVNRDITFQTDDLVVTSGITLSVKAGTGPSGGIFQIYPYTPTFTIEYAESSTSIADVFYSSRWDLVEAREFLIGDGSVSTGHRGNITLRAVGTGTGANAPRDYALSVRQEPASPVEIIVLSGYKSNNYALSLSAGTGGIVMDGGGTNCVIDLAVSGSAPYAAFDSGTSVLYLKDTTLASIKALGGITLSQINLESSQTSGTNPIKLEAGSGAISISGTVGESLKYVGAFELNAKTITTGSDVFANSMNVTFDDNGGSWSSYGSRISLRTGNFIQQNASHTGCSVTLYGALDIEANASGASITFGDDITTNAAAGAEPALTLGANEVNTKGTVGTQAHPLGALTVTGQGYNRFFPEKDIYLYGDYTHGAVPDANSSYLHVDANTVNAGTASAGTLTITSSSGNITFLPDLNITGNNPAAGVPNLSLYAPEIALSSTSGLNNFIAEVTRNNGSVTITGDNTVTSLFRLASSVSVSGAKYYFTTTGTANNVEAETIEVSGDIAVPPASTARSLILKAKTIVTKNIGEAYNPFWDVNINFNANDSRWNAQGNVEVLNYFTQNKTATQTGCKTVLQGAFAIQSQSGNVSFADKVDGYYDFTVTAAAGMASFADDIGKIGLSGRTSRAPAFSVTAASLQTGSGKNIETNPYGDIVFRVDNWVAGGGGGTVSAGEVAGPSYTGNFSIAPTNASKTIEYGDFDVASIVTDVYYTAAWSNIFANAFTVGNANHNGQIIVSQVTNTNFPVIFQTNPNNPATLPTPLGPDYNKVIIKQNYSSVNKSLTINSWHLDIDGSSQVNLGDAPWSVVCPTTLTNVSTATTSAKIQAKGITFSANVYADITSTAGSRRDLELVSKDSLNNAAEITLGGTVGYDGSGGGTVGAFLLSASLLTILGNISALSVTHTPQASGSGIVVNNAAGISVTANDGDITLNADSLNEGAASAGTTSLTLAGASVYVPPVGTVKAIKNLIVLINKNGASSSALSKFSPQGIINITGNFEQTKSNAAWTNVTNELRASGGTVITTGAGGAVSFSDNITGTGLSLTINSKTITTRDVSSASSMLSALTINHTANSGVWNMNGAVKLSGDFSQTATPTTLSGITNIVNGACSVESTNTGTGTLLFTSDIRAASPGVDTLSLTGKIIDTRGIGLTGAGLAELNIETNQDGTFGAQSGWTARGNVYVTGDFMQTNSGVFNNSGVTLAPASGNTVIISSTDSSAVAYFGGKVSGDGDLNVLTNGTVDFADDLIVGLDSRTSGAPGTALLVRGASLRIATGKNIETKPYGNIEFQVDGWVPSSGTGGTISAGKTGVPTYTGTFSLGPRDTSLTIEYGDTDTSIIATPVYYSSKWTGINALSFTVGSAAQNGSIYVGGVSATPFSIAFRTSATASSADNLRNVIFSSGYSSSGKNVDVYGFGVIMDGAQNVNLGVGIWSAYAPTRLSSAATGSFSFNAGGINFTSITTNNASGADANLSLSASGITGGSDVTISGGTGTQSVPLGTVNVTHTGNFTTGAMIYAAKGFNESGTMAAGKYISLSGGVTTINNNIVFVNDVTAGTNLLFATGNTSDLYGGDIYLGGSISGGSAAAPTTYSLTFNAIGNGAGGIPGNIVITNNVRLSGLSVILKNKILDNAANKDLTIVTPASGGLVEIEDTDVYRLYLHGGSTSTRGGAVSVGRVNGANAASTTIKARSTSSILAYSDMTLYSALFITDDGETKIGGSLYSEAGKFYAFTLYNLTPGTDNRFVLGGNIGEASTTAASRRLGMVEIHADAITFEAPGGGIIYTAGSISLSLFNGAAAGYLKISGGMTTDARDGNNFKDIVINNNAHHSGNLNVAAGYFNIANFGYMLGGTWSSPPDGFLANAGTLTLGANTRFMTGQGGTANKHFIMQSGATLNAAASSTIIMDGIGNLRFASVSSQQIGSFKIGVNGSVTATTDISVKGDWEQPQDDDPLGAGPYRFNPGTYKALFTGATGRGEISVSGNTRWYDFTAEGASLKKISFSNYVSGNDRHTFLFKISVKGRSLTDRITLNRVTDGPAPDSTSQTSPPYPPPPPIPSIDGNFWVIDVSQTGSNGYVFEYIDVYHSYADSTRIFANPATVSVSVNHPSFTINWNTDFYLVFAFTEDANKNGKIDRVRIQATGRFDTKNVGFGSLKINVEGYKTTGYSTSSGGSLPAAYIYVNVEEKEDEDGNATPRITVDDIGNIIIENANIAPGIARGFDMFAVDTVPPRINYSLAHPSGGQIYVEFSEPVLELSLPSSISDTSGTHAWNGGTVRGNGAVFALNGPLGTLATDIAEDLRYDDAQFSGTTDIPPSDWPVGPVTDLAYAPEYPDDPNYSSYSVPNITLAFPGDLPAISSLVGASGGMRTQLSERTEWRNRRRVSDLLLLERPLSSAGNGTFWPLNARVNVNGTFSSGSDISSTGGRWDATETVILSTDTSGGTPRVDVTIPVTDSLNKMPRILFDVDIAASFRRGGDKTGLWLPDITGNAAGGGGIAADEVQANLVPVPFLPRLPITGPGGTPPYNYIMQTDLPARKGTVDFIFEIPLADVTAPRLFAVRLDDGPAWWNALKTFAFEVREIERQIGGVTILNNVINPDKGDKARLSYLLSSPGQVTINVFTMEGVVVRTLHRGYVGTGEYFIEWDGKNNRGRSVARGMYFIRVVAPDIDEMRKVMVVK